MVPAAALCTLGSVTVPSLASVFNEFALKKHMDTSMHEQVLSRFAPSELSSSDKQHGQRAYPCLPI